MMVKMQHSVQRGFQGYCLSLSGGFSASRLLGLSGGFSASRLARRLLGFAASRLLGLPGGSSASRLLGFSACPVASRLLGFLASRLVPGFSASRLLGLCRTSRLLGFSACVGLLGFSASGRISGPLLPVLCENTFRCEVLYFPVYCVRPCIASYVIRMPVAKLGLAPPCLL